MFMKLTPDSPVAPVATSLGYEYFIRGDFLQMRIRIPDVRKRLLYTGTTAATNSTSV
jgi:hypothetical protein